MNLARVRCVVTATFPAIVACAPEPQAPPPAAPPVPAVAVAPAEPAPTVRLPGDTRPTAESVALTIDPTQDRFSGVAEISVSLDHPRRIVWLHGKGFHVTRATATVPGGPDLTGAWQQIDDSGFARLTFPSPVSGTTKLHIEYDVPFGPKLEGLYKVAVAGGSYAFTQFESIAARDAFPCFDEPAFKIPWDETLVVPRGMAAVANTHEVSRTTEGDHDRVRFATTLKLPSYLVAFAVGPLDVVQAPDIPPNAVRDRPVPLRAITTKGHGKDVAYALAHTGEILSTLERIFGIAYPYDKLDILAVSDKGGAMENAGAVTFSDTLLLFDEKTAPLWQKRSYARVMAHELAHQWTGDLVTAEFWNDIWLNEAFATWIGTAASDAWDPKTDAASDLLDGIQGAIGADSLVSARAIRQPIESTNDIQNAFDAITYEKGGGVLAMFERWVGPETFRKGLHDYLAKHAFGAATADDFLDAESAAAGRDVKTPFHTFLDQPGVPLLETELRCDGAPRLHVKQSRYFPVGSSGDPNHTWQIPVCVRYQEAKEDAKETCSLVTTVEADIPLGKTCPSWAFPNASSAGYYRFTLASKDLAALRARGLAKLDAHERVAFGNSLRVAFNKAALPMTDLLLAAAPLATDSHREVAEEPMGFVETSRDWLFGGPERADVEAYGRRLFAPVYARLGWDSGKSDDGDRRQLRAAVIGFLANTARDPNVRAEAKKRGLAYLGVGKDGALHPEALEPDFAMTALSVAGANADRALWERVKAQLAKTETPEVRWRLLSFLTGARDPALIPSVRELALDPALRSTEVAAPLRWLLYDPETREGAWAWEKENFDKLFQAVPKHFGQTGLLSLPRVFCDEGHARDVEAFFTKERVGRIDGGPRVLASTLEGIRLCAAKKAAELESVRAAFGPRHARAKAVSPR